MDIGKLRYEVCKSCVMAAKPVGEAAAEEYLVRMAGLFDAGALMWCKIHGVNPGDYPPGFLHELSQAAVDAARGREPTISPPDKSQ